MLKKKKYISRLPRPPGGELRLRLCTGSLLTSLNKVTPVHSVDVPTCSLLLPETIEEAHPPSPSSPPPLTFFRTSHPGQPFPSTSNLPYFK